MVLVDAVATPTRVDWRDLVALCKPRLSGMVLCSTGVGLWAAPGLLPWPRALLVLLATALVVGGANAINSYLERDVDRLMRRTRQRPLAARRLEPSVALWFSGITSLVAIGTLFVAANPLTALLAFIALAMYGWVYTPMKRYSWLAVVVGAVPGAIPPLMGWTAVTASLSPQGWALFALLFFWQLPHFFAIAIYLQEDYARGGLKVLPGVFGLKVARHATVASAVVLWLASLWPAYLGMGGPIFKHCAMVAGLGFVGCTRYGMHRAPASRWARRVFIASIVYLTLMLACLTWGAR